MSTPERKRVLRRTANEAISAMASEARCASDAAICTVIRVLGEYVVADQVIAYWPLADEVDLCATLFAAVDDGKMVFLPVIRRGELTFRRWTPQTAMSAGVLGVQEPLSAESPAAARSIVLVPGRAFSAAGHRLGRGGGFYDRAWRELGRYGPRVGIAYSCQLFAEVPHDEHDSIVDLLVCERGVVSESST